MTSMNIYLLAIGLLAAIAIVILTATTRRVVALGALILLIPFQIVETKYGSSSVLMAYAMIGAMLLTGNLKVRMLPAIGFVLLAYLVSLTQADTYLSLHAVELFQLTACFVVFLLAYNYAKLVKSERSVVDLLIAINVLAVIYCALQLSAGAGQAFDPLGVHEFAFNRNRDPSDPRLVGPFDNPGTTAGYFTLMTLIYLVELISATSWRRRLVQALILANVAGIVATGNRASFLVLIAAFPVLIFAFRAELGPKRFFQFMSGGIAALVISSALITALTGFGNMFTRLQNISATEDGLPTTRAGTWPLAIEKIKRDPWFGEGPHYFREEDAIQMGVSQSQFEDLGDVVTAFDPYPHSLYLFLLRTVGIVGLVAMIWFFVQVAIELRRSLRRDDLAEAGRAFTKTGIVVIGAFLVSQITLEFNRTATMDYAQFIMALLGLFIGISDRPGNASGVSPSRREHAYPVGAADPQ